MVVTSESNIHLWIDKDRLGANILPTSVTGACCLESKAGHAALPTIPCPVPIGLVTLEDSRTLFQDVTGGNNNPQHTAAIHEWVPFFNNTFKGSFSSIPILSPDRVETRLIVDS